MFDDRVPLFKTLERHLGARGAKAVRWLIFLPAGLAVGVVAFAALILIASGSGDEDVAAIGGRVAGAGGGFLGVLVGLATAPGCRRVVAVVMAAACVAFAVGLFCWARASHNNKLVLLTGIAGDFTALARSFQPGVSSGFLQRRRFRHESLAQHRLQATPGSRPG